MATAAVDGFIKFWTGRVTIILISASLESMLLSCTFIDRLTGRAGSLEFGLSEP